MDLQLKHILPYISTYERIRFKLDDGEEFYPTYKEVRIFEGYYVVDISAINADSILVGLKENI